MNNICKDIILSVLCMLGSLYTGQAGVLTDSTATISGRVTFITGMPMEGVSVQVVGGNVNTTVQTDAEGYYEIADLSKGVNYAVNLSKTDSPTNGVDMSDLVTMRKHILAITSIQNPFNLYAMDVNASSTVTTFDLVLTRKLILGIDPTWPNTTTWQFIYTHITLTGNPWDPLAYPVFDGMIDNLQQDIENLDFTGVKTGDANLDVDLN